MNGGWLRESLPTPESSYLAAFSHYLFTETLQAYLMKDKIPVSFLNDQYHPDDQFSYQVYHHQRQIWTLLLQELPEHRIVLSILRYIDNTTWGLIPATTGLFLLSIPYEEQLHGSSFDNSLYNKIFWKSYLPILNCDWLCIIKISRNCNQLPVLPFVRCLQASAFWTEESWPFLPLRLLYCCSVQVTLYDVLISSLNRKLSCQV